MYFYKFKKPEQKEKKKHNKRQYNQLKYKQIKSQQMKRTFTKLMAALALLLFIAPPLVGHGQTTETLNIASYASANGWANQTQYLTATVGDVTFIANGNSNTGKYYTNDNTWRFYANESATLTISVPDGNTLVAVTPTFTIKDNGTLNYNNANVTSGNEVAVSGNEAVFSIGSSSGNKGKIFFTQIAVTYTSSGSTTISTSITINDSGITNTNVFVGTEAGSLSATVSVTGGDPIEGATVTWTSNNEEVATINETTGVVTLVAAGTATITASYAGNETYSPSTKTYSLTVINQDPNAPGTQNNPYTVAQARAAIDAGTGTQDVYATGIVSEIVTEYSTQYYNITFNLIDNEGDQVYLQAYRCGGDEAADVTVGDIAVVHGNLILYQQTQTYEFAQGCQLVSLEHPVNTDPSITVNPATVNAPAEGAEGTLTVAYENITDVEADVYFCDAEGQEATYDWITAEINAQNNVEYLVESNDGAARTAYFKVYAMDDETNLVYSNLVTVNQDEYVAPTYATLAFEFNGGRDDIESTDGLYQNDLGTDYNANNNPTTKLKFDGTGDWLLLQFQEQPGTLSFDIKGNSFSGGTFKVQTSEDGVTYTDLESYTTLDDTQSEEFTNLGENVRYIKWIYTEKSSGNVGLGNIALTKYEAPQPAITLNSYSIEATAEETEGTLTVTYTEIETDLDPEIYWFESDGVTAASKPDWMSAEINTDLNVEYLIEENEGEARTAYFKVYGVGTDESDVYSDLVTVSQAAAPQQYTLTVAPFENLELITFVNDEMVLESDGEIQVNEGDQIMLSVVADDGYVMETLMVNGVNHVNDITNEFTFEFDMPAENVTISATAVENVAPAAGYYVRITSLDQLTDGSKVIIAARYDEEHTNGYYAMSGETSGKPTGVAFDSETSGNNEIIPATITASEDTYYWTVNVTSDSYTFTNANGDLIGYNSGTNFSTGNNSGWEITNETSGEGTMVPDYTGFVITNVNNDGRAFALNTNHNFGPYAKSNMNGAQAGNYNFYLDIFVQSEAPVTETYTLDNITGYSGEKDHYYLIASPVTVNPENVEGMTTGDFDLYYFDQSQELE